MHSRPDFVVQYIRAENDDSGNPRRGWIVVDTRSGHTIAFIAEGYDGWEALWDLCPRATTFCMPPVRVTVGEYKTWVRFEEENNV